MNKEPFSFYNQRAMSLVMLHRLRAEQAPPEPKGPTEESMEALRLLRESEDGDKILAKISERFMNKMRRKPHRNEWYVNILYFFNGGDTMNTILRNMRADDLANSISERHPEFGIGIVSRKSHDSRSKSCRKCRDKVYSICIKFVAPVESVGAPAGGTPAVGTSLQEDSPTVGTSLQEGTPTVGTSLQEDSPPPNYEELE